MKHVGKLAIFGALLKAVKTSRVRTTRGHSYRSYKAQALSLALVTHILQNSKDRRIAAERRVVKAQGSWVIDYLYEHFPFSSKNLSTHKCVPTSSQGISFPLLSFQSRGKIVNKRQYLGIRKSMEIKNPNFHQFCDNCKTPPCTYYSKEAEMKIAVFPF